MSDDKTKKQMSRALALAKGGEGLVEPNPMVGCVIVRGDTVLGEGYHQRFGGAHAEVNAIQDVMLHGHTLENATCFVTLEPCSHHGKTPPCTEAIIKAGIRRVVMATRDPNPAVNGRGVAALRQAGIEVVENVMETEALDLLAPYLTRLTQSRPWVIAKWAMTLDGKLATRSGDSRWISSPESRERVHLLRSRVDAVLVGLRTAIQDDPLLTIRPATLVKRHVPLLRIVLDRRAELPVRSQLVQTARDVPLWLAVAPDADEERIQNLSRHGVEIYRFPSKGDDISPFLAHLAEKNVTNLLIEGGGKIFGTFFDQRCVDEIFAFIAPKLVGGETAASVVGGFGIGAMSDALKLQNVETEIVGGDICLRGRVATLSPTLSPISQKPSKAAK